MLQKMLPHQIQNANASPDITVEAFDYTYWKGKKGGVE